MFCCPVEQLSGVDLSELVLFCRVFQRHIFNISKMVKDKHRFNFGRVFLVFCLCVCFIVLV